jgi:hypothetical protein
MLLLVVTYKLTDVSEVLTDSTIMIKLIALTMNAVSTSETSANFYETIRCNMLEDNSLRTRRRKNPKSLKIN